MDTADIEHARQYCTLVGATDLLEHLGLGDAPTPDEAKAALSRMRRRMQGMQSNPKYRDAARYLIKNQAALKRVLEDLDGYRDSVAIAKVNEQLPFFELAVEGVLADGDLTLDEVAFVVARGRDLGISGDTAMAVLEEHAARHGIPLPDPDAEERTGRREESTRRLKGVEGRSWWSSQFTRALLDGIPAAPGDLLDLYCREGLSGRTVIPERPQLSWTGIDKSPERLAEAQQAVPSGTVVQGEPNAVPLPAESADIVLLVRALANLPETESTLAEAARLLRPGGRLLVVEPDGLAETFYANGHLVAFNEAFHTLAAHIDARMRIAAQELPDHARPGLSVGPDLERRVRFAGLTPLRTGVHATLALRERSLSRFASRLERYASALARSAGLSDEDPSLEACRHHAGALTARGDVKVQSGNLLPLFICVAEKPA